MKIMVLGGYGKLGRLIVRFAQQAQWDVTVVAHRDHPRILLGNVRRIIKDVVDLTQKDIARIDVIVDTTGGWRKNTAHVIYDSLAHVVELLDEQPSTRYLKVGGANTLYINREHSQQLQDLPSYYPAKYQFLCAAHQQALTRLRTYSNLVWTYVTPPVNFIPDGLATGEYQVGSEEFKANLRGDDGRGDYISYADFAQGLIAIIKENSHLRQQITLFHGDLPTETK
ncbi:MAG TPA: hypothetical protein DCW31_10945 [Lactobacillus sp.]|nr:hypothetical protein [Lactobacillus sp.]